MINFPSHFVISENQEHEILKIVHHYFRIPNIFFLKHSIFCSLYRHDIYALLANRLWANSSFKYWSICQSFAFQQIFWFLNRILTLDVGPFVESIIKQHHFVAVYINETISKASYPLSQGFLWCCIVTLFPSVLLPTWLNPSAAFPSMPQSLNTSKILSEITAGNFFIPENIQWKISSFKFSHLSHQSKTSPCSLDIFDLWSCICPWILSVLQLLMAIKDPIY